MGDKENRRSDFTESEEIEENEKKRERKEIRGTGGNKKGFGRKSKSMKKIAVRERKEKEKNTKI